MNRYFANFDHLRYKDRLSEIYFSHGVSVSIFARAFAGMVLGALLIASTVDYSKVTTIQGRTASEKGIVKVFSSVGGVVTSIHAKDGQRIERGDDLFVIKPYSETPVALGDKSAAVSMIENLNEKTHISNNIKNTAMRSMDQAITLLENNRRDLIEKIKLINEEYKEIRISERRSQENMNRYVTLIEKNFFSKAALIPLEADLSAQKKAGYALLRQKKDLEMQLQNSSDQIQEYRIKQSILISQHRQEILGIEAETISANARDKIVVKAPLAGIIQNISANEGDAVQQKPLAMVVPVGAAIIGEALVPSRDIGFIRVGQEVRVRYLAYPYQKYGTFRGLVVDVGYLPSVGDASSDTNSDLNFKVRLQLIDQNLKVGGKAVELVPGMAFNADIKTDTRLIGEWILDPVLSLGRYF